MSEDESLYSGHFGMDKSGSAPTVAWGEFISDASHKAETAPSIYYALLKSRHGWWLAYHESQEFTKRKAQSQLETPHDRR